VFLMGLFSLIDAILDCSLADILEELPISKDVKAALLGNEGFFKDIQDLTISYERADWAQLAKTAKKLGLPEEELPALYLQTLSWAREFTSV